MPDAKSNRTQTLLVVALWTLLPACLAAVAGSFLVTDTELRRVIYAGAGTLFFGGFLGGMLKVFLDEVVASKNRRDEAASFVSNILSDLKGVYDRVARARIVIPAHKSAKTYGEEMRGMIEARVQLRNVARALERKAEGMEDTVRDGVVKHVERMESYLETLTSEFRDNYKPLSDQQRAYEERSKKILARFADSEADTPPPDLPGFVWESISRLECFADFTGEGSRYKPEFEAPLDDASELLRTELARILGAESPRGTRHSSSTPRGAAHRRIQASGEP